MAKLVNKFFDLLKKVGTNQRHQVAFGVFFVGLTLIISSHLLDEYKIGSHFVWVVLLEVGIAFIIASIAEFILLEHVSQIFRQEIRDDIRILSHCMEHQLVDILSPYTGEQNLTVKEINSAVEKSRGEICVLAYTLQGIRHSVALLRGPLQKLQDQNVKVAVKLLLIDPKGDGAQIRVLAEEGSETPVDESELYDDLWASIKFVKSLLKKAVVKNNFTVEARFYNTLPSFYMISTPSEIFIEMSHLGHNIAKSAPPIEGDAPLFLFSSDSTMYKLAKSHFEYIWSIPESRAPHRNGNILVRNMDDTCRKFNRRNTNDRRAKTSTVPSDRREPLDRREQMAS